MRRRRARSRSGASGSIARRRAGARRARRCRSRTSCRRRQRRLAQSLRLVIKADQGGPAEALADALGQLSTSEVRVEVIHRGVGAITESDILLAQGIGRDHHRLPRAPGQQRARGGRARGRRDQAVPDHLRSGGGRARRARRAAASRASAKSCSARPRCASCSRCRGSASLPAAPSAAA